VTAPRSERRPRRPLIVRVEETRQLTPHMIRVVVGGDDLAGFAAGAFTDHYVKLQLPPPGAPYTAPFDAEDVKARLPREQWPRTRTYSVRAWDPERQRLTIDFVVHGDTGVAGPWAAAAAPGDLLQLNGPGGAYAPDPDAAWHLMVGDTSVIPAIAASLERVPAGVPVHVLIEIEDPADQQPLSSPGALELQWLAEGTAVEALRKLTFPEGAVHAFVHGEASTVRDVRRHLLVERGLPREALSVSGYWKRSRTEEGWRED
jgi:NADPH-dependent ferric siderophore reductase